MGKSTQIPRALAGVLLLASALGLGFGCVSIGAPVRYDYFGRPSPGDLWSRKIRNWQQRERGDFVFGAPAAVSGGTAGPAAPADGLRAKYDDFRATTKRAMARRLADWIQHQAREHYVPDGPIDRWATLEETLRANGDDCDGLELLVYYFLRDLGFGEDEVFRAVVYRRSDGQHHMVTLWFETPDDPWVIDPTGAMTEGMPHMSSLPGWVPLKIFSEDQEFTARRQPVAAHAP